MSLNRVNERVIKDSVENKYVKLNASTINYFNQQSNKSNQDTYDRQTAALKRLNDFNSLNVTT